MLFVFLSGNNFWRCISMKQKNKLSMVFSFIGILIFVAMGLSLWPGHNNLMIFLGIACFLLAGLISRMCNDGCKTDKKCEDKNQE